MSVLRSTVEQALARIIARLFRLPDPTQASESPVDPRAASAPYVPRDMPRAYDGREMGAAKITNQALSDSVLEGLKEDLEELGLEYMPSVTYNVSEIAARAGHKRADRALGRSEQARAAFIAAAQPVITLFAKDAEAPACVKALEAAIEKWKDISDEAQGA